MFRKLHLKLTAYMGIILILFMFFVASGIYKFTRIIFEDGNKELMQTEALRIYNYKILPMQIIFWIMVHYSKDLGQTILWIPKGLMPVILFMMRI